MLSIDNISAGYDKKQVLYNLSMRVEEGEVILLSGGNGSGKSTLLKCIYNLLPLWSGNISFQGMNTIEKNSSDLIKRGIVYIPQKEYYFENLTVLDNLRISGITHNKRVLLDRINDILDCTGLAKFKKRRPFDLSGGERKILAFGMALVNKPKLLLFDEPFAGVDIKNSSTILRLFNEFILKSETGLIIVEHREDAKKMFTRQVIMELGKIVKDNNG